MEWPAVAALLLALAGGACVASAAPPPVVAPSDDPPPMTASAAGGECRFAAPVVLGPSAERVRVSVGFGARSGLVAWLDAEGKLRLRPLDLSGAPVGPLLDGQAIDNDEGPVEIDALGHDFVVTVARSERLDGKVVHRRRAVLVRPDGERGGPLTEVGAPDLWVRLPRSESRGGRFAYVGWRGDQLKGDQPAVWVETHASPEGAIVQEVRPIEPALSTGMGESRARVSGEGPIALLLARSRVVVIDGHATRLSNPSLARIDAREHTLAGRWIRGGGAGLLGAPDRHLRIAWFEGDKVHVADVRADGTTSGEVTSAPLAPLGDFPDELELWGGGHGNTKGYAPSFSRIRVFLPHTKTVQGVTSVDKRFELPDVELEGGAMLPIEDGAVRWSGTRVVYVYREGSELKSRSATCTAIHSGR